MSSVEFLYVNFFLTAQHVAAIVFQNRLTLYILAGKASPVCCAMLFHLFVGEPDIYWTLKYETIRPRSTFFDKVTGVYHCRTATMLRLRTIKSCIFECLASD